MNEFVKNAFDFYQQQWQKDNTLSKPEWITITKKNDVVNYKYPYTTKDGSIIVLKKHKNNNSCIL
jgi:hypothetical protein